MIQPINALTPKVLFKGQVDDSKEGKIDRFRQTVAIVDATGTSAIVAAIVMAFSRSYTSTWHGAGWLGLIVGALTWAFLTPHYLSKAGIKTKIPLVGDTFTKENVQKGLQIGKKGTKQLRKVA